MYSLVLIEDEPLTLDLLASLIQWEKYGFTLLGKFEDSKEALEFIKKRKPDLVISDIKMPKVSGLEIAKYCFENLKGTQVALISAYRDFEYAKQAIKYSVKDYIEKPVNKKEMINLLESYKSEHPKSMYIPDDDEIDNIQLLFADLIYGMISNTQELKERFKSVGLSQYICDNPCAVFTIHINKYEDYINNVWKYDKDSLYRAIYYITSKVKDRYEFYMLRHSFNNVEIIALSNDEENDEDLLYTLIEKLMSDLNELLCVECETMSVAFYDSVSYLMNKECDSEKEELSHTNETIKSVYDFIKDNYKKSISSEEAADYIGLSNTYFCVFYKKYTGETFLETLNKYRIEKAKEILREDREVKPSRIYSSVGFSNQGYFYKVFKRYTQKTPDKYLKDFLSKSPED